MVKVANGSDFVRRTLAALSPTGNPLGSAGATMLIDLHAYDGSPGIAALEDGWGCLNSGPKFFNRRSAVL